MQLKECFVRNVGPIESLDLTLPFRDDGSPKPLVLVGSNGSGKSTALAQIADGLWELAAQVFDDVSPDGAGLNRPYLLTLGGTNIRSGTDYSLVLLTFIDDSGRELHSRAKSGTLDKSTLESVLDGRFGHVVSWPTEGLDKHIEPLDKENAEQVIRRASLSYFPSWRRERPHWITGAVAYEQPDYTDNQRFSGKLGRELVVAESAEANKAWIRDLILDSRVPVDVVQQAGAPPTESHPIELRNKNGLNFLPSYRGLENVNSILQSIMCDDRAQITVGNRSSSYRVAVRTSDGRLLTSLSHLSAGQAVAFNMFATIIRYADLNDASKAMSLSTIRGVALVDEIDAHLDAQLQREVLPVLISMLPKVQFIVTSHSPLFLLGMEERFGRDGFECREMPGANIITAERFTEFERSYQYFRETERHEEYLRGLYAKSQRPLVLTEGKTDVLYLKHAFDVLGHTELLENVDIVEVGRGEEGGTRGGGNKGLDNAWNILTRSWSSENRVTVLLYDHDTEKPDAEEGNVFVRSITGNPDNHKVAKGIEHLLPEELFEERFYTERQEPNGYGAVSTIREFEKIRFCEWVCEHHTNVDSFRVFDSVAETLWSVVGQHIARG